MKSNCANGNIVLKVALREKAGSIGQRKARSVVWNKSLNQQKDFISHLLTVFIPISKDFELFIKLRVSQKFNMQMLPKVIILTEKVVRL